MNSSLRPLIPFLSLSAAMVSSASAFGFWGNETLDAKATDAAITTLTSKILENSQFAHQQLDDALAGKFLDRYFDSLDSGHMLFLQSDIEEFAKYRPQLAKSTRVLGESSVAHLIFKRYLERLNERQAFITEALANEKFDFTKDETFSYDRKNAPYPADIAAAKTLWHQQLRYEYLQEKLGGKEPAQIIKRLGDRAARSSKTMAKLDETAVLELYLNALARVYDPHSDYMSDRTLKGFQSGMNLSLIGIGATLRAEDGFCKVMELVPGGPAARSGLINSGDRIVGVSQKQGDEFTDLIDLPLDQAVSLIRGKKNTPVILNLLPATATDESVRKTITIIREEIKLEDQQAKAQIIDLPLGEKTQRIGVIDIPAFYAGEGTAKSGPTSVTADVRRILEKLKKENVTGVILDLRKNGGGSLEESIDLTGLFIPTGPVVQTRNPQGRTEISKDLDPSVTYDGPLIVLTSRFSASASEILAGALQDYGRAVIVGDTATFGKGTVQQVIPLSRVMESEGLTPKSDPGGLKVTISKFYRPSGKSTQLEGVKADIVIPSLTDLPEIGEADMENPLPWDTIPAAKFVSTDVVSPSLSELRKLSETRVSQHPGFAEMKAEIERFQKLRQDKSVSLNEEARRKEKAEIKERNEALKQARLARATTPPPAYEVTLKSVNQPGPGELVKPKPEKSEKKDDDDNAEEIAAAPTEDLVLLEAQKILVDYSAILKGERLAQGPEKQAAVIE